MKNQRQGHEICEAKVQREFYWHMKIWTSNEMNKTMVKIIL